MGLKITIGITCFNAHQTIVRAIQSALTQDYPTFEIVIVDDGSTDGSVEVISDFIKDHKNIQLIIHERNKGFPAALNTLLSHATGEHIAFFDDDDVSEPNRLTSQMNRIMQFSEHVNSNSILCYSNRSIVLPGKSNPDHIALAIGRKSPEPHGTNIVDFILWHTDDRKSVWGLFGSCTLMMRTDFLRDIGGFDESFRRSAEWDMAIRAAASNAYFIAVDEPLITQYKTPTADKSGAIPLKYALQLREKHKEYLSAKGVYWASICLARYQNSWGRKQMMAAILWMGLACLLAPRSILWEKLTFAARSRWKYFRKRQTPTSGVFSKGIE